MFFAVPPMATTLLRPSVQVPPVTQDVPPQMFRIFGTVMAMSGGDNSLELVGALSEALIETPSYALAAEHLRRDPACAALIDERWIPPAHDLGPARRPARGLPGPGLCGGHGPARLRPQPPRRHGAPQRRGLRGAAAQPDPRPLACGHRFRHHGGGRDRPAGLPSQPVPLSPRLRADGPVAAVDHGVRARPAAPPGGGDPGGAADGAGGPAPVRPALGGGLAALQQWREELQLRPFAERVGRP